VKILENNITFSQTIKFLLKVCIALSISFVLTRFDFYPLDAFFYDLRIKLKPTSPTSDLIVTVNVDEFTLDQIKREPDIKDHIKFLTQVGKSNPKKIIYTIDPTKLDGNNADKQALAHLGENLNIIYASKVVPQKGLEDELQLSYPFDNWNSMPAPRTRETVIYAKDFVTRRMIVSGFGRPTMYTVLAAEYGNNKKPVQGLYEDLGAEQTLIDMRPAGTYPEFSLY